MRAMFSLQTLREARTLVRWMLVWFALSIGVAVAAPVVHPQAMTLICTTTGSLKFVPAGATDSGAETGPGGASAAAQPHNLECVFCLPAGAPPAQGLAFAPPITRDAARPSAALAAVHLGPRDPASARGPPDLR